MEQMQAKRVTMDIDLKNTKPVACDECKGIAFQDALVLRWMSVLVSPTGKEGYLPIQAFVCVKCGHVNNQFLPEELRSGLSLSTH